MTDQNPSTTPAAGSAGVVVSPPAPQPLGYVVNGLVGQYWRIDDLDAGDVGVNFLTKPAALVRNTDQGKAAADAVAAALTDLRSPPPAISDQEAAGLADPSSPSTPATSTRPPAPFVDEPPQPGRGEYAPGGFTPDELRLLAMAVWLRVDRLNAAADEARQGKLDLAPGLDGVAVKLFSGQAAAMLALLAKIESMGAA